MGTDGIAVVAFGGNALIREDEPGYQDAQIAHAEALAGELLRFLEQGRRLLLVHGNGPQVGNSLIRVEESMSKVPGLTLDACDAQTEGTIGFFLELALRNALAAAGREQAVVCLLSQVEVDAADPGLAAPSKPIGPFYNAYRADYLVRTLDWDMVEDAGRGYRRVVASPRPVRALNAGLVSHLLDKGAVVIAGGGGGIPVVRRNGRLAGVEAVIDKDYTAALLAREVGAGLFLILTAVDHVSESYGTEAERPIREMGVAEARRRLEAGEFPPGSMGPKIEAAISFARARGGTVLITSVEALPAALEGREGTRIVSDDDAGEDT